MSVNAVPCAASRGPSSDPGDGALRRRTRLTRRRLLAGATCAGLAGNAVLAFMRAVRRATSAPVHALSQGGTTALVDPLGPAARGLAVTQVVPFPVSESSPLTPAFGQAMRRSGLAPTYDRLRGYLNASILVEILRLAGPAPSPSVIQSTIERMGHADIEGHRLSFDASHHNGSRFVEITMIGADSHHVR